MKRTDKSHCPVNFALESFGDSWSLLIVRDMVYWGKKTYGEFMASSEGIATNILASRLDELEQHGIVQKAPHPTDKRKDVYGLTEKGLDLIPILLEMSGWSTRYDSLTTAPKQLVAMVYADRVGMFELIRETVKAGGSLFVGPNNVMEQILASSKRR